ncbi:MAG: hypothetical protein NT080_12855 [Spirochaetes bacterium]|nr:hypothetical protein [Spirochaetota bacterium]
MRRFLIAMTLVCLAGAAVFAQSADITEFQTTFEDFTGAFAATLALNSTVGNTWSDAYIGAFPHLGAGLSLGFTSTDPDQTVKMFEILQQPVPDWASETGLPVPAVAATVKLGFLFIPIDLGLKVGFIPKAVGDALDPVKAEYTNVGASIRFRVLKDNILLPEISLGGSVNYLEGSVSMPVGDSESVAYNDGAGTTWTLDFTKPEMKLAWKTTTVDMNAQISKNLFFLLTPYVGGGITLGTSTVDGGVESDMLFGGAGPDADYNDDLVINIDDLKDALADAGQTVPDFSATGFMYSAENSDPVIRIYGGASLNLLILVADFQAMYVPETKNLGLSVNARIQL